MTAVCDIRELPGMTALNAWAREHEATVRYLGPTLESKPLYAATRGAVTRVARGRRRDPHALPLVWTSPLERLPL